MFTSSASPFTYLHVVCFPFHISSRRLRLLSHIYTVCVFFHIFIGALLNGNEDGGQIEGDVFKFAVKAVELKVYLRVSKMIGLETRVVKDSFDTGRNGKRNCLHYGNITIVMI